MRKSAREAGKESLVEVKPKIPATVRRARVQSKTGS